MDGLFAAASAELGGGQSVNRFLQTWGGARHATSSSSGAAASSAAVTPGAASSSSGWDRLEGLRKFCGGQSKESRQGCYDGRACRNNIVREEWDALEWYSDEQLQQYSKEEWDAWHADGPKRKGAKVDKTDEKEEAKVEETYEEEEANVAKDKDVAKEEATWLLDSMEALREILHGISSEDEDSLEARGGQSKKYCKGFYDGRACRKYWKEETEVFGSDWVAREVALKKQMMTELAVTWDHSDASLRSRSLLNAAASLERMLRRQPCRQNMNLRVLTAWSNEILCSIDIPGTLSGF